MRKSKIQVGDIFKTNSGDDIVVVDYVNSKDITVRFLDKHSYTKKTNYSNVLKGKVKNPYRPSVFGVGFYGVGQYKAKDGNKITKVYNTWKGMLERAYCEKSLEIRPTYSECSVVEEWHNFQVFAEWYYKQPNAGRKGFHLDKDLLVYGNKEYGPNTCSFVPCEVNSLLTDCRCRRGDLPQGVGKHDDKYYACTSINGKNKYFGRYSTPEEAYEVYKQEKKKQVKIVAERNKSNLHPKVYANLMRWELV